MPSPLQEGDLFAGKYRVERVLGEGGMGVVVAATHVRLLERVAIKVLPADGERASEVVQRFLREGRAATMIKNDHVVRVLDVDVLPSGAPYIVMEFLEGSDLRELLDTRGPCVAAVAVDHVLQACEALEEAHRIGIVHRDLKPANLFLTHRPDGSAWIKVLDFGISKLTGAAAASAGGGMTTTKSIVGSPFYMSPEQLLSPRDVDARADVWALGVVLYELLSGEVPFSGESMPEVCARVLNASPPPLTPDRADLPDGLEQIIAKCLAKDRAHRYQSMAELASALSALEGSGAGLPPRRSDRVRREGGISSAATTRDATPAPTVGSLSAGATSQRALFAVTAVAATIGIFVVLGRAAGREPSDARQGADPKGMTTATAIDVAPATASGRDARPPGETSDVPASGSVAPPSASASAPAAPVLPTRGASARAAAPKPARALPRSAVAAAPPAATARIDDPFGDERK